MVLTNYTMEVIQIVSWKDIILLFLGYFIFDTKTFFTLACFGGGSCHNSLSLDVLSVYLSRRRAHIENTFF